MIRQVQVRLSTVAVVIKREAFNFLQNTCNGMIPDTRLLLDSQSTCGWRDQEQAVVDRHS